MGDNSEPLTAREVASPALSHKRILIEMAAIILGGSLVGLIFFSIRAGAGVVIGGALGFANYFWQKRSLKAIFDRAVDGKRSRFLAIRYIGRYVVLGGALTAIYWTASVSIYAVIFGLASFSLAVMIDGLISIFSSTDRQES
jgi:ATP synthase I chain